MEWSGASQVINDSAQGELVRDAARSATSTLADSQLRCITCLRHMRSCKRLLECTGALNQIRMDEESREKNAPRTHPQLCHIEASIEDRRLLMGVSMNP